MKEYRTAGGQRQLWYERDEIERIMQDELHRAGLLPDRNEDDVTVDLEGLVEHHLKLPLEQYAPLDADVLGMTEFPPGRPPKISINADLTGALDEDETPGVQGRWRATLAHEVAHVLLHRWLFDVDDLQRGLFPAQESERGAGQLMRCLKRNVGYGTGGSDPREVQANMGMSALLMPKEVLVPVVQQARAVLLFQDRALQKGSPGARELIQEVARRFSVSKQAAGIRLEGQDVLAPTRQDSLGG